MSMEFKVRKWLWIVLATVVVLGGGFTYWYVYGNKSITTTTTIPTPAKTAVASSSPTISSLPTFLTKSSTPSVASTPTTPSTTNTPIGESRRIDPVSPPQRWEGRGVTFLNYYYLVTPPTFTLYSPNQSLLLAKDNNKNKRNKLIDFYVCSPGYSAQEPDIAFGKIVCSINELETLLKSNNKTIYEYPASINSISATGFYVGNIRDQNNKLPYYTIAMEYKGGFFTFSLVIDEGDNINEYIDIYQKVLGSISW